MHIDRWAHAGEAWPGLPRNAYTSTLSEPLHSRCPRRPPVPHLQHTLTPQQDLLFSRIVIPIEGLDDADHIRIKLVRDGCTGEANGPVDWDDG